MFPNTNYLPTRRYECSISLAVAPNIRLDLRHPECFVGTWLHVMIGTAMPEAAVHEDSNLSCSVHDVSRPVEADQGSDLHAVT